jgi:hypothetical protein
MMGIGQTAPVVGVLDWSDVRRSGEPVTNARGAQGEGLRAALREFVYGMTGHEFARHTVAMRANLETIFMVTCVGDMIGLPIIPPYYSLRLLPFVIPQIATWKRRVLRERHFSEEHDYELHGV